MVEDNWRKRSTWEAETRLRNQSISQGLAAYQALKALIEKGTQG
jgi:hypothetical protein